MGIHGYIHIQVFTNDWVFDSAVALHSKLLKDARLLAMPGWLRSSPKINGQLTRVPMEIETMGTQVLRNL